jgi:hypothetical protein
MKSGQGCLNRNRMRSGSTISTEATRAFNVVAAAPL